MFEQMVPAVRVTLVLVVLTGLIYPAAVTGLAWVMFPETAGGSLIHAEGKLIGSELIGQKFERPEYFHGRPSAAGDGYDAGNSGGSNLGPTSKKLAERVIADVARFRKENPTFLGAIPADLVTASGSGLDPHISPASAYAQVARVAAARKTSEDRIKMIIDRYIENRQLGVLGERRVNVLKLNLALNQLDSPAP